MASGQNRTATVSADVENAARITRPKSPSGKSCGLCEKKPLTAGLPGLVQTKLVVGPANDRYEKEADSIADRVMSMPPPSVGPAVTGRGSPLIQSKPLAQQITPLVQRQASENEEEETLQSKASGSHLQRLPDDEEESTIQTKRLDGRVQRRAEEDEEQNLQTKLIAGTVQRQANDDEEESIQTKRAENPGRPGRPRTRQDIESMRGGGQALNNEARQFFEPRFGQDFSHVRVHSGATAARAARSIHARAFTLGNNIVFGSGQLRTDSDSGRQLLAHELTHVIQQSGSKGADIPAAPGAGSNHGIQRKCTACSASEKESDDRGSGDVMQRKPEPGIGNEFHE